MEKVNLKGLKAAILTMSFLQMATNAVASILNSIAESLQASASGVQYLMTFPNLLVVVMSVVTARLTVKFPKKKLALLGSFLGALAGILSFLLHGSLILLYAWAGLLGIGIGLVIPIANSLIADYFEGNEKDGLLGLQTSAANVGSMLMTFLGGYLAILGWHYTYFVYLLAIPGLICIFLFVPEQNVAGPASEGEGKSSSAIPAKAVMYFAIALVFMLAFYVGPTNLSMFVAEKGIGDTVVSGTAATILLAGGAIMGILFGKVAGLIGKLTIPAGFLMLVLGYLMIYNASGIPMLYLGSFLVGTSNTLVLPQCMGSVGTKDKQQTTMLMALCLATANLGTFLAPVVTGISAAVMGNDLASSRFLFIGIVSGGLVVISTVLLKVVEKKFK